MRRLLAIAAALLVAPSAFADTANPYLAQAAVFYVGLEYEKCVERIDRAGAWKSTPEEAVQVELYAGLCKYNLRRIDEAREHFRMALLLDPKVTLPPLTSPPIRELFASIAETLPVREVEAVAATPVPAPEKTTAEPALAPVADPILAPVPTLSQVPTPRRSWVLPVTLGGVSVGAAGVGAFLGVRAREYETAANRAGFTSVAHENAQFARGNATAANVSYATAAAFAVSAAVVLLFFPPESEARP